MNRVDPCCTCNQDQTTEREEDGDADFLRPRELQVTCEDEGHGVEHDVGSEHEAGVEIVEGIHVYAVSRDCLIPDSVDGSALEDCRPDACAAEREGDGVHGVDAAAGPFVHGEFVVEEEEGVLYAPVAYEVEEARRHDELRPVSKALVNTVSRMEDLTFSIGSIFSSGTLDMGRPAPNRVVTICNAENTVAQNAARDMSATSTVSLRSCPTSHTTTYHHAIQTSSQGIPSSPHDTQSPPNSTPPTPHSPQ